MGRRGPKPDPEKQSQIQTKIYLTKNNWEYVKNYHERDKTRYFNRLVEQDRLENEKPQSEGATVYPVKSERIVKG